LASSETVACALNLTASVMPARFAPAGANACVWLWTMLSASDPATPTSPFDAPESASAETECV